MEYTKGELARWLRSELVDLVKDIETVRKAEGSEFNQGLDTICAFDTKVEKILDKLACVGMYEALKTMLNHFRHNDEDYYKSDLCTHMIEALRKAEGK